MKKRILASMMAIAMMVSMIGAPLSHSMMNVHADEEMENIDGVYQMGEGTASITIEGNAGQSLLGKKFNIYKLFNTQSAEDGSSIQYTFADEYKEALQNVVDFQKPKCGLCSTAFGRDCVQPWKRRDCNEGNGYFRNDRRSSG